LASNKKEIEDNFKSICNKIQPINLKLNNNPPLEKIPECKEKDKYNVTNKSEQNTTLVSNNINNLNNSHHTNENLNKTNSTIAKKSKLKEIVNSNGKRDENNVTGKSNKSKYINKNNKNSTNENLLNDTINFSIDKKMNVYDKKLGDLESFTKEQIFELIKQINIIKKSYSYLTNIIKKENSSNSKISNGYNTNHNVFDTSHGSGSFSSNNNNNNYNNNENQNNLNLTGNNFYKKPQKSDLIKFGSNKKIIQTMDDINFSDNLFYNGKYYFNIKDIFEKNRNSLNLNIENKRLLKQIDNKFLEENAGRNRSNSSSNKNIHFKSNNTSLGGAIDNKWIDIKKLGNKTAKYNKKQKPQSGVYPCPLLVSGEK
jgi:CCR4-NOT transcription complex subunit 7/8